MAVGDRNLTIIDGFVHQLPGQRLDRDAESGSTRLTPGSSPREGQVRGRFLLGKAAGAGPSDRKVLGCRRRCTTPYVNTIPAEEEPPYPGDEHIERRIRRFIRWNAAVMVIKANHLEKGIGGHLSTFASSATLYEVGFNHFWRGKEDGNPGDHIYIQGHAAPGIYARAFLERRFDEEHLDRFRGSRSVAAGFPRTPTPGSCPTSGNTPRCRWDWGR